MKTTIHRAESRGHANHGWLQTFHTFSFARYYDPARIHFGALRVLNDDTVAPSEGFGTHPHDNMEIVSIPLSGALRHGDSMSHREVIRPGQIQVMSAGTGITHSEMNDSDTESVKFLQIWIFPDRQGLTPRYETVTLPHAVLNALRTIVTPKEKQEAGAAWIHQHAWLHTIDLHDHSFDYEMRGNGGLYLFVLEGEATVAGEHLAQRDGIGVWDTSKVPIAAKGKASLLLIEVPM